MSEVGGHLAASLGTVELTVALHSVLQQPARQDRLGRRSSVLRSQAAHRSARRLRHHPPVRRALRVPQPRRIAARRRRHGPRLDVHQLRPRSRGGRQAGARRRRQRGVRARRRGAHRRRRLRSDEPGRAPAHPPRRDPQRQPDVHPRQRRRPAAVPQPHPSRPDAHASARRHRARRRAHPRDRPAGVPPRQGRQGVDEGAARSRACCSRSSASPTSASSTATTCTRCARACARPSTRVARWWST